MTASTSLQPSSSTSHNICTRRYDPTLRGYLTGMTELPPTPPPSLPLNKMGSGRRASRPPSLSSHATATLPPSISAHQVGSSLRRSGPSLALDTAPDHFDRRQLRVRQQKAARLSALNGPDGEMAIDGTVDLVPGPRPSRIGTIIAERARKEAETSRLASTEESQWTFAKQLGLPSAQPGSTISNDLEQEKREARSNPSHRLTSLSADMTRCKDPVDVEFAVRKINLRADQPVGPNNTTTPGPYFETFSGPSRGPDPEGNRSRQERASREVYRSKKGGTEIGKVTSAMLTRRKRSRTRSRSGDGTYSGGVKGIGEFW
jgi:hypothetical protein